uniref:Uncharacterized protein n=1 Tax=Romanomermis culicivorax TaxID=13658 RepID=A0A915HIN2_ROMCU
MIELRPYLKNEQTNLRSHPKSCLLARVWSLDMAHPLWGTLELGTLKQCVFACFWGPVEHHLQIEVWLL